MNSYVHAGALWSLFYKMFSAYVGYFANVKCWQVLGKTFKSVYKVKATIVNVKT